MDLLWVSLGDYGSLHSSVASLATNDILHSIQDRDV